MRLRAALLLCCALAASGAARAEPDAAALGSARGYPAGSADGSWYVSGYRVGSWSAMDRTGLPTRAVARGATVSPLPAAADPPAIRYRWRNLAYTLDDYLEHQRITGLIVLKDGQVVAERYRYGRGPEARFLSFSMAKSITSLLVGIAAGQGLIASLDDPAQKYVPALAGSAYGGTPVRDLLRMSSGLTFTERYDGQDDIARMSRAATIGRPTVTEVLHSISDRHAPAGARFVYASAETEVLGRVLAGATGRTLADLTSEWLWQPIGAERDAFWVLSAGDGQERASGFFNASLRDWARVGVMLARDGRAGDRQVVPRDYLLEATAADRQPASHRPRKATPYMGYGYQFWLLPFAARTFAFQGIHGQALYVQPESGVVMVQTAVWDNASSRQDPVPAQERDALWRGVLRSLGAAPP